MATTYFELRGKIGQQDTLLRGWKHPVSQEDVEAYRTHNNLHTSVFQELYTVAATYSDPTARELLLRRPWMPAPQA